VSRARLLNMPWTAIASVLVVGIIGSAIGVYVGFSLTHHNAGTTIPVSSAAHRQEPDAKQRLILAEGDVFPNDTIITDDGATTTFSLFYDGTPSVLHFWLSTCPACSKQADLWNKYMTPAINADVKEVICWPVEAKDIWMQHPLPLKGKWVVFFNYERFLREYNLVVFPTTVSLDGDGTITHIGYEYAGRIDEEFVELLTHVPVFR
jgi:hypothetical protein